MEERVRERGENKKARKRGKERGEKKRIRNTNKERENLKDGSENEGGGGRVHSMSFTPVVQEKTFLS